MTNLEKIWEDFIKSESYFNPRDLYEIYKQAFYAGFVAGVLQPDSYKFHMEVPHEDTKTEVELWQEGVATCKRTGQHNKSVTNGYCNNCGNPPSVE